MAGLGHLAVGMAAARIYPTRGAAGRVSWTAIVLWSVLSFLPDADVIGFGLGVRYEDEWGHRGATHSFFFALVLGAAMGAVGPRFRLPAVRTGLAASLVLASHPLLDTLTNGGLGCALFWPFDLTRYFAPWTPIPVSPIGLGVFSPYGLFVAMAELVLFAPLFWFSGTRRGSTKARTAPQRWGRRAILIVVWVIGVWLLTGSVLRETRAGCSAAVPTGAISARVPCASWMAGLRVSSGAGFGSNADGVAKIVV